MLLPLVVAISVGAFVFVSPTAASGERSREAIPLLAEPPSLTAEFDMPKAVRARLARAQRKALATLKRASKQQPSRAAGCTSTDVPAELGPPAPNVTSRVFGQHVEVVVRFDAMPASTACRPAAIQVSIKGKPIRVGGDALPLTEVFRLRGPVGRAVIQLPYDARPPYQLVVEAGTVVGRRSKSVRQTPACPPTGCLAGPGWTRNGKPLPQPVFPTRGIDRRQLQTSFLNALAVAIPPPFEMRDAGCASLVSCQVTFTDPLFPRAPYRVRYTIEGEQVSSCWRVGSKYVLDPLPYEDTYQGPTPAGCASWLR